MKKALKAIMWVGLFGAVLGSGAHAAVDLGATATAITADLTSAQGDALPIFGLMFGVPLALAFFRRIAH